MHTSTQRATRTRKPTAVPFSATAAKLIEQIQAEARDKLLTDLSAQDAIVVLHGFDAESKRIRFTNGNLAIDDAKGNTLDLYRHYTEPEAWRGRAHMAGFWHPAYWYGNQTLTDAKGIQWRCDFEPFVCDDFGNLVQVAR